MKKELRRIEAMLAQLADQRYQAPVDVASLSTATTQTVRTEPVVHDPSFDTSRYTRSQPLPYRPALPPLIAEPVQIAEPVHTDAPTMPSLLTSPALKTNQSTGLSTAKVPMLPLLQVSNLTSHLPTAKPLLAVDRLKAIAAVVVGWQDELQQLLHQIQALYAEGPLVDGWLEPCATDDSVAPTLRRSMTQQLVNDVSGSVESEQPSDRPAKQPDAATLATTATSYRLCGFNADGQLWFRHCPAEQVAAVSLAILRYERLKHHLTRKQHLETQLDQLAEALAGIQNHMQAVRDY